MELEYYIIDPDSRDSDWETVIDLMNERSKNVSHPHYSGLQGRGRKVAEELDMADDYQQGDFGVYILDNYEEAYHAVNDNGWHIVGESQTLDGFIPEIYSIWTEKGKLHI